MAKWKKQPGLGDRVLLMGNHPHAGKVGTYDRDETTLLGTYPVVKLDTGESCFVMRGVEWRRIGRDESWTK